MSYVHPAWLEGQRQRWQRHDWKRWVKPEAHHLYEARQDKARAEPAEDQVADVAFLAEVEALRADHQRVRIMLADLKFELALRALGRKYSPDQPRVPAGYREGGQWTSGGGGAGSDDSRVISEVTPDNEAIPGAQYAQGPTQRPYSVVLADEEAPKGIGHTIRDHVGKSDEELLDVVQKDWIRYSAGKFEITDFRVAEGSFLSLESANDLVNRTLEDHKETVDRVASGELDRATLDTRFGYPTGKEAFRSTGDSEPYIRDTYAVRVVVRYDSTSERGYAVRTAFPINEYPK